MMKHLLPYTVLIVAALAGSPALSDPGFGTPDEAKAMLERAVVEVRTNKAAALEKFNHNEMPFRDRDLFVFCFNGSNGQFTAHEAFITHDVRDLRDANGAPFGAELYSKAEQGRLNEVAFIAPVPGSTELAIKSAYVTRIGDQVCGVSAYQIEGGHDRAIRSAQRQRW